MTRYALVSAPRGSALQYRGDARGAGRRLGRLAPVDHGARVGGDAEASIIDRDGAAGLRIRCESGALVARDHRAARQTRDPELDQRGRRRSPRRLLTSAITSD